MLLRGNQKYIDPSALLKKLIDRAGKPVHLGNQEDVSGKQLHPVRFNASGLFAVFQFRTHCLFRLAFAIIFFPGA
jgi:hypothetical protein